MSTTAATGREDPTTAIVNSQPSETHKQTAIKEEFQRLHERLGHRAPEAMRKIATELGIPWRNQYDDIKATFRCELCLACKMPTPARLPARSEPKATRAFQRVYVDTIENLPMEVPPKKTVETVLKRYPLVNAAGQPPPYMLVITDEYTRYTWVEPVESKRATDVGLAFTKWKQTDLPLSRELRARSDSAWVNEREPPREILAVHSDSGSEFHGAFDMLCRQGGFAHVCSPPYTQSKNGVVEGRIKLIKQLIRIYALDLGRCTASDAVYFAQFATSQINMLYTAALNTSPFFAMHGRHPNPQWLRKYGETCFVRDHRPSSPTKGRKGYLIGISIGPTNGMRVWFPEGSTTTVHDAEFSANIHDGRPALMQTASQPGPQVTSTALSYSEATGRGTSDGGGITQAPALGRSSPSAGPGSPTRPVERVETEDDLVRARSGPSEHLPDPLAGDTSERTTHGATDPPRGVDPVPPRHAPQPNVAVPEAEGPTPEAPCDSSGGPSGRAPTHRSGEGARSEDASPEFSRDGESGRVSAGGPTLDQIPGRRDVGMEIHRTPSPREEQQPQSGGAEEPTEAEQPLDGTSEPTSNLRRSTRDRKAPSRYVGRVCVNDPAPELARELPPRECREDSVRKLVEDATVDVTRKMYGGTTEQIAILDPVALQQEQFASELSAYLTTPSSCREKIDVIDLCAGSHSLERALENAGVVNLFNVISIDVEPSTNPRVLMKVEELAKALKTGKNIPACLRGVKPKIIWASPPCTPYSAANTRRTEEERKQQLKSGDKTVQACLDIIQYYKPIVWFLENPDNQLPKQEIMVDWERYRQTTTYCLHGRPDRKATTIYTNLNNLTLSDCRRQGEECLTKLMLGRHTVTAQAGASKSRDGTVIPGTPKVEAQKIPVQLMTSLLQKAFLEHGPELWSDLPRLPKRLQAFAVNTTSDHNQLGRRVRNLSECGSSEILEAKKKELRGLIERGVFEVVDADDVDRSAPSLQPVWVLKVRDDDTVKARLCAGGHRQTKGVNFWEISSPTPRSSSVKLALGIAATNRWEVHTADVSQAYVASELGVLMYMRAPPEISEMGLLRGNQTADSVRLKLVKSLYGAKQSGRNWHQEASNTLTDVLSYRQCDKDPCVFYKAHTSWADEGPSEIIILYVDDFLFLGRRKSFDEFMTRMRRVYDITASDRDQKIKIWNGLEIARSDDGTISVTQVSKIRQMGRDFKAILDETASSKKAKADHPEYVGENHFDPNDAIDVKTATPAQLDTLRTYQAMVGSAMYVATYTRFDICYALSKASRLMHCASEKHVRGMARVIKYLVEHEGLTLTFRGNVCTPNGTPRIFTFTDSDYGGEPPNRLDSDNLGRKSTSAVVIMAFGTAIYWKSKLQPVVATSTGEAEFRAMWLAVAETLFCIHFLHELGYESYTKPLVPIFCDSNVGVAHAKRDGLAWLEGTKQYETQLSCTYQHCRLGNIVPIKIDGKQNPADILSKSHIGTVDKCESARRRISGHKLAEPFETWMRHHLIENFDGSSMIQGGFVSRQDLLTKYGLSPRSQ